MDFGGVMVIHVNKDHAFFSPPCIFLEKQDKTTGSAQMSAVL